MPQVGYKTLYRLKLSLHLQFLLYKRDSFQLSLLQGTLVMNYKIEGTSNQEILQYAFNTCTAYWHCHSCI